VRKTVTHSYNEMIEGLSVRATATINESGPPSSRTMIYVDWPGRAHFTPHGLLKMARFVESVAKEHGA